MCGIAGILQRRGTVELGALERMAEGLRHRGPDDRGIERIDAVGLAHTRLSIIDLAGGHQPLMTPERDLSLVANGEIYNYVELREALEREHGVRFATGSDSETILHAYAVHGLAALEHLHGMFAFALYDRRRGRLILARDRLGIKPLYYAVAGDRLAFASEIKALLPALPRSPALAPGAVMQFLQSQFSAGADTALEGVHRVLPGEAIVVDSELNLEHHRYWSPLDVQPSPMSEAQATEAFDGLFDRVMREHVRSDVPYGAFLSGGVDSGTLVGCLTRFQEGPVRTFSVGYAGADERGELAEAERIARRFGTRHRPLRLDRERIFRRIPHMIWSADELMRDYACLPTALLAEAAGRELKVVFTGEGGDEVFAGYGRYRPARATALLKALRAPGSGGFRTRGQWGRRWRRVLGPRLRPHARGFGEPFRAAWQATPAAWDDLMRRQYTDIATALPENLLVKVDRMLMAAGVEGRVPLLDHRVVELGLSLPATLKVRGRTGKWLLRQWARRYLPEDHLQRRKTGFHVPIRDWLKGRFLEALEERLARHRGVREWFDGDAVKALIARQRRHGDASRETWCLMHFAIWHDLYVEGREPPGVDEDPLAWVG